MKTLKCIQHFIIDYNETLLYKHIKHVILEVLLPSTGNKRNNSILSAFQHTTYSLEDLEENHTPQGEHATPKARWCEGLVTDISVPTCPQKHDGILSICSQDPVDSNLRQPVVHVDTCEHRLPGHRVHSPVHPGVVFDEANHFVWEVFCALYPGVIRLTRTLN